MGIQTKIIAAPSEADALYLQLFKDEIRDEIEYLKNKIEILESKIEDPFG